MPVDNLLNKTGNSVLDQQRIKDAFLFTGIIQVLFTRNLTTYLQ